ncbi:hypothetical protein JY651_49145 [Pyxidicoccus parkwayensis]|uniref:Lipoprotein n=1 Tax=Pyxidicoccus parkwayensis TaxID=2813578 RepID=A0ABX7NVQ2_9BACT|nr:hypothetical protein [Pyxidicoccus parkwaysis]QSQ22977.1 hypothetical protein JY651_49145 [Pyxidicoccus parkwaysis]
MPRPRLVLRMLLPGAILAGVACASQPTGRPPVPHSAYSVQLELGQRDVIQAGEEYARNNAFLLSESRDAVEIRPNYWRVRFGLANKPGRGLELEFDELARRVTRAQEIEILPGELPNPGQGGSGLSVPNAIQ